MKNESCKECKGRGFVRYSLVGKGRRMECPKCGRMAMLLEEMRLLRDFKDEALSSELEFITDGELLK